VEELQVDLARKQRIPTGQGLRPADNPVVGLIHQRCTSLLREPRRVLALQKPAPGSHETPAVQLLRERTPGDHGVGQCAITARSAALQCWLHGNRADRQGRRQGDVGEDQKHAAASSSEAR